MTFVLQCHSRNSRTSWFGPSAARRFCIATYSLCCFLMLPVQYQLPISHYILRGWSSFFDGCGLARQSIQKALDSNGSLTLSKSTSSVTFSNKNILNKSLQSQLCACHLGVENAYLHWAASVFLTEQRSHEQDCPLASATELVSTAQIHEP